MKLGDPGYWEWRKNVGVNKSIESPQQMWELACDYFQSVDDCPFVRQEAIKGGDSAGRMIDFELVRPFTWQGFEAFLFERGIIKYLKPYRQNVGNAYDEFQPIMHAIGNIMYERKFDGAALNHFNANIIARELGLVDKKELSEKTIRPMRLVDAAAPEITQEDNDTPEDGDE